MKRPPKCILLSDVQFPQVQIYLNKYVYGLPHPLVFGINCTNRAGQDCPEGHNYIPNRDGILNIITRTYTVGMAAYNTYATGSILAVPVRLCDRK